MSDFHSSLFKITYTHSTMTEKNKWEFIIGWQRTWHPEAENNIKVLFPIHSSYRVVSRSSRSSSCDSCSGLRQPPNYKTSKWFSDMKATGFWFSSGIGTNRSRWELLLVTKRTKLGFSFIPMILSSPAWVGKIEIILFFRGTSPQFYDCNIIKITGIPMKCYKWSGLFLVLQLPLSSYSTPFWWGLANAHIPKGCQTACCERKSFLFTL